MYFEKLSKQYVIFLFIFLISFAVFGNTFRNDWTYDDRPVVVENPDAQSLTGFLDNSRPGRPLRDLSYIPDHMLFGDNPAGYHIQQIGWHAANGCLLYILMILLGLQPLYAVLGTIFFLIHPLQAESIANISHRKEPLALFFSLAAVILYIKVFTTKGKRSFLLFTGSFICYLLALSANETTVSLPVLFVIYELLFVKREDRLLLRKPRATLVLAAVAFAFVVFRYRGLFSTDQLWKIYSKNAFIATESFYPLYMGVLKTFGSYMGKIVFPLQLAPEYVTQFSEDWFQPAALLSLLLVVLLVLVGFYFRLKKPAVSFAIAALFLLYLPISNVVPAGYMMADRYMYMPLIGVAIGFAFFAKVLPRRIAVITAASVMVPMACLTVVQNSHWRDEHSLWRHAVKVNPDSTWCQEAAAHSFMLKGDLPQALYHARKAVELTRFNARSYLTLAKIEEMNGNLDNALKNYELFQSVGEVEFPDQVLDVRAYLPVLRERVRILQVLRKG